MTNSVDGKAFGRSYRLTLFGADDRKETLVYEPPMQIRFNCSIRPGNSSGSSAEVTLYGISRTTRENIFDKFDSLQLEAGYGGQMGLIFSGEIMNIEKGREGTDQYIQFFARPAGRKFVQATISKTWGDNTPQAEIIRDVAATFSMPVEMVGDFSELPRAIKGRTFSTKSTSAMRELADLNEFNWYLGANRVMVIKKAKSTDSPQRRSGTPHIISAQTGMVGSPQLLTEKLEVSSLINAAIIPGDAVEIIAETYNFAFSDVYRRKYQIQNGATYEVLSVGHVGDFYGDTWQTSVVANRPRANQQRIAANN